MIILFFLQYWEYSEGYNFILIILLWTFSFSVESSGQILTCYKCQEKNEQNACHWGETVLGIGSQPFWLQSPHNIIRWRNTSSFCKLHVRIPIVLRTWMLFKV